MNSDSKYANSANNGSWEMESGPFDDGENSKHNGVSLVKISRLSSIREVFYFFGN